MHVSDEELELYLLERLEKSQTRTLEFHLANCGVCATKLSSVTFFDQLVDMSRKQAAFGPTDKRREPRISTDDPGVLQKINPFSPDRMPIQIVDISKGGMRVSAA